RGRADLEVERGDVRGRPDTGAPDRLMPLLLRERLPCGKALEMGASRGRDAQRDQERGAVPGSELWHRRQSLRESSTPPTIATPIPSHSGTFTLCFSLISTWIG